MATIEIKSRWDGRVLFSAEAVTLKLALAIAVNRGADLGGANLRDADLGDGLKIKALLQIGPVDGWWTLLWSTSSGYRLRVGCHLFTLEEAEAYWRGKESRRGLYLLATEGWKALVKMAGWE